MAPSRTLAIAVLLVAALLVALPMAGCIPGPSDPAGSADEGAEAPSQTPEASRPCGNVTGG